MIALDIITGALRSISIIGETQSVSAEQGARAVIRLNDLMAQLAEKRVDFGWAPISTSADTISLPLGFVQGVKAQLAELLASDYGVDPIPPAVVRDAEDSRNMMLRAAAQAAFGRPNLNSMPFGCGGVYDITTGTYR